MSPNGAIKPSSDRTFGLVMTAFFLLAAVWPLVHARSARPWMAVVAAAFLAATMLHPPVLHPLNGAWTALAVLLHRIVSPVVLGILFFLVVTPVALVMRWSKRDALRLHPDPSLATYWLPRDPPGPAPQSMLQQF